MDIFPLISITSSREILNAKKKKFATQKSQRIFGLTEKQRCQTTSTSRALSNGLFFIARNKMPATQNHAQVRRF